VANISARALLLHQAIFLSKILTSSLFLEEFVLLENTIDMARFTKTKFVTLCAVWKWSKVCLCIPLLSFCTFQSTRYFRKRIQGEKANESRAESLM